MASLAGSSPGRSKEPLQQKGVNVPHRSLYTRGRTVSTVLTMRCKGSSLCLKVMCTWIWQLQLNYRQRPVAKGWSEVLKEGGTSCYLHRQRGRSLQWVRENTRLQGAWCICYCRDYWERNCPLEEFSQATPLPDSYFHFHIHICLWLHSRI